MATARPIVSVHQYDKPAETKKSITLPEVFSCPLRADLVRYVHSNIAKNKRQAMGLKDESGYDTAAASWGTGRAVARIPRVPGGGTHRSGQGAFGNMCRGGGMFNPTKTWRKWHRKVNVTQKRHAVACAISASAVPALVMARGHRIDQVPEVPLVVSDGAEACQKTKDAVAMLKGLGCEAELEKSASSKQLRRGKGKMRNRRYVMRKGPLVIYAKDEGISRAFRNIPGVDLASVERLNLLQLAPGGSFGRFTVWTEGAVKRVGQLFGTKKGGSMEKKGYTIPRSILTNTDISRIINSSEVQSVLRPAKESKKVQRQRKNPLKNRNVLGRLCPVALKAKKIGRAAHDKTSKIRKSIERTNSKKLVLVKKHKKASKTFFKNLEAAYAVKKTEETAEDDEE